MLKFFVITALYICEFRVNEFFFINQSFSIVDTHFSMNGVSSTYNQIINHTDDVLLILIHSVYMYILKEQSSNSEKTQHSSNLTRFWAGEISFHVLWKTSRFFFKSFINLFILNIESTVHLIFHWSLNCKWKFTINKI